MYAQKALEIDSKQPEAHDLLGGVLAWYDWQWEAGERQYRRAIELNPNYADVRCFYSLTLHAMGRSQGAHSQIERALELDPYNSFSHWALGILLNDERRPDEALFHLQRAATLQPDSMAAHCYLWYVFEQKRDYEKALAEAIQYHTLLGDRDAVRALREGYAQDGYCGAMRRTADAMAQKSRETYVSAANIALLYALAGENDRTLDWLEKAYEEHASKLGYINVISPLHALHSHPRFKELARRIHPYVCRD